MNKKDFIRIYLWISVVAVVILGYLQYSFTKDMIGDLDPISGTITRTLFRYNFENYNVQISVFNTPLIMYIAFLLLTVFVAVYALKKETVDEKRIQEVVVYNGIISILLIVSNIVFMVLIPETVSGTVEFGLFMVKMPIFGGEITNVFNFTYIFMIVYIVLNVVVLQFTKTKKHKKKKVELDLDSEFLR